MPFLPIVQHLNGYNVAMVEDLDACKKAVRILREYVLHSNLKKKQNIS